MKKDKSLIMVKKIISNFIDLNCYQLFVFGSRAEKESRKFSDFDIGILGEKPVPAKKLILIEEALEESDLPYCVDIVDFHNVSDKFKKIALAKIKKI